MRDVELHQRDVRVRFLHLGHGLVRKHVGLRSTHDQDGALDGAEALPHIGAERLPLSGIPLFAELFAECRIPLDDETTINRLQIVLHAGADGRVLR